MDIPVAQILQMNPLWALLHFSYVLGSSTPPCPSLATVTVMQTADSKSIIDNSADRRLMEYNFEKIFMDEYIECQADINFVRIPEDILKDELHLHNLLEPLYAKDNMFVYRELETKVCGLRVVHSAYYYDEVLNPGAIDCLSLTSKKRMAIKWPIYTGTKKSLLHH